MITSLFDEYPAVKGMLACHISRWRPAILILGWSIVVSQIPETPRMVLIRPDIGTVLCLRESTQRQGCHDMLETIGKHLSSGVNFGLDAPWGCPDCAGICT